MRCLKMFSNNGPIEKLDSIIIHKLSARKFLIASEEGKKETMYCSTVVEK